MNAKPEHAPSHAGFAPSAPVAVDANAGGGLRPDLNVDSVFLSPRVVDRKAFNELSAELRGLVERAVSERGTIASLLDQALKASQQVRESEQSQQGNLTLAAKAIKGIDERLARTQKLIEEASKAASSVDDIGAKVDRVLESRIAALEARAEAAQAASAARIEALEERIRVQARELEQRLGSLQRDADQLLGPAHETLRRACDRAEALTGGAGKPAPGTLGDLVHRGEIVKQTAEGSLRRLEEVQGMAQSARSAMSGILDDMASIMGRVDAQRQTLGVEAERVREACKQAGAEVDRRLIDMQRSGDRVVAEIKPRIDAVTREALAAGEHAASVARQFDSLKNELATMVRQSQDTQNTTALALRLSEKSVGQVHAALAMLEPWKPILNADQGADPHADLPGPVRALMDSVRRELQRDLGGLADALRLAAGSAERAFVAAGTPTAQPPAGPGLTPAASTPAAHSMVHTARSVVGGSMGAPTTSAPGRGPTHAAD